MSTTTAPGKASNAEMRAPGRAGSAGCFLISMLVIFCLMIGSYVLSFVMPAGQYSRTVGDAGETLIIEESYHAVRGGLSFWKWILSPLLVLTAPGSGTLISVLAFLLVLGGVMAVVQDSTLMNYLLSRTVRRYGDRRYTLLAVIVFLFMALGSLTGSLEEAAPLVPMAVALAVTLGWDRQTGLCMSLMAVCCGYACGISNPFTVGVAQHIAGLPVFSGILLRLLAFALVYALLLLCIRVHAGRVEGAVQKLHESRLAANTRRSRGVRVFFIVLCAGVVLTLCAGLVPALKDWTLLVAGLAFLAAGIGAAAASGMKRKAIAKSFLRGMANILPTLLMILMAAAIGYILRESRMMDALLHAILEATKTLPRWLLVLFVYLAAAILNFFVCSGPAKAFMLLPFIVPLAQVWGIPGQLCILAFIFGDGFSGVLYATNPALRISLGLAEEGYGAWLRASWKYHLMNLVLSAGILLIGLLIGC